MTGEIMAAASESIHAVAEAVAHTAELTSDPMAVEIVEHAPLVVGLDIMSVTIAAIIGYIGVLVMAYGCLLSIWQFIRSGRNSSHHLPLIRVNLGKHLALGLEFLVGKDIVESIVSPTWDDLGKLGAIIILRTVVTIFLSRELKEVEEELNIEERGLIIEKRIEKESAAMEKAKQQGKSHA